MKTFKVNLNIEANSPEEVEEKLQAFQDLQDNLEHEDLVQAVEMIVLDFVNRVIVYCR